MAVGELEVLLQFDGFVVNGSTRMTIIQAYIDIQEGNLGGEGVPDEVDWMMAIGMLNELCMGVMKENVNNPQTEAGLAEFQNGGSPAKKPMNRLALDGAIHMALCFL